MLIYHGVPIQVKDYFVGKYTKEVCIKIFTPDENRWTNGWVRGSDLSFTEGDSLQSACDAIDWARRC